MEICSATQSGKSGPWRRLTTLTTLTTARRKRLLMLCGDHYAKDKWMAGSEFVVTFENGENIGKVCVQSDGNVVLVVSKQN